jgi:hypothetical protein
MNIYKIYGMQRSGNHAIINWLIENLSDDSTREYIDGVSFVAKDVSFLNHVMLKDRPNTYNNNQFLLKDCLKKATSVHPKSLILSYEDVGLTESNNNILGNVKHTKIIIVRNLENLVASRLQFNIKNYEWYNYFKLCDDDFFRTWETHVNNNFLKIHYDKWLIDKNYRNLICEQLNIINKDITNIVTSPGNGSSFIGQSLDSNGNLLSRYQQINMPKDVLDKILYYGEKNLEYCNIKAIKEYINESKQTRTNL